jgi:hypothetical protein
MTPWHQLRASHWNRAFEEFYQDMRHMHARLIEIVEDRGQDTPDDFVGPVRRHRENE